MPQREKYTVDQLSWMIVTTVHCNVWHLLSGYVLLCLHSRIRVTQWAAEYLHRISFGTCQKCSTSLSVSSFPKYDFIVHKRGWVCRPSAHVMSARGLYQRIQLGAYLYYVCTACAEKCTLKGDERRRGCLIKTVRRGREVKKSENVADIMYVWPPVHHDLEIPENLGRARSSTGRPLPLQQPR